MFPFNSHGQKLNHFTVLVSWVETLKSFDNVTESLDSSPIIKDINIFKKTINSKVSRFNHFLTTEGNGHSLLIPCFHREVARYHRCCVLLRYLRPPPPVFSLRTLRVAAVIHQYNPDCVGLLLCGDRQRKKIVRVFLYRKRILQSLCCHYEE